MTNEAQCWLLLKGDHNTGDAVPVSVELWEGIDKIQAVVTVKHSSVDLIRSAEVGARHAYQILSGEGYLTRAVRAPFRLSQPPVNIEGHSAGLAFALCFAVNGVSRQTFKPLAATGVVDEHGSVVAIEGINEKVVAALEVLPEHSQLFFPEPNRDELKVELLQRAERQRVELIGVHRVDEAIGRLGIALNQIYLQSPFRGLEAFEFEHAGLFFGRSAQVRQVCELLQARAEHKNPSVILIGASGSGKSSLALAGVLPELVHGNWFDPDVYVRFGCFRPRDVENQLPKDVALTPVEIQRQAFYSSLTASLQQRHGLSVHRARNGNAETSDQGAPHDLSSFVQTLLDALNQHSESRPGGRTLFVLVIDQLEELFTLGFASEVLAEFTELVRHLAENGVWLLATLRSDFYERYQNQPRLLEFFEHGVVHLYPPTKEFIEQIITYPAARARLTYEKDSNDVSLATKLELDVGDNADALPLLEFTLHELYERRNKSTNVLTRQAYNDIRGLHGAIAHRAEAVYDAFSDTQQTAFPRLLRLLVTLKDDSRVSARSAALSDDPNIRAIVDRLVDARLLVREGNDNIHVRVTHEALLTQWKRAKDEIEQSRSLLRIRDDVTRQATKWLATPEDDHKASLLLPPGLPLNEAEQLLNQWSKDLEESTKQFVQASIDQRERQALARIDAERKRGRRNRNLAIAATITTIVFAIMSSFLVQQRANLKTSNKELLDESIQARLRKLTITARDYVDSNPGLSWNLATLVYSRAPSKSAETIIFNIVTTPALLDQVLPVRIRSASGPSERGATRIVTESNDHTVQVWDLQHGEALLELKGHTDTVWSATFSPDGTWVLTASDDKTARLWDARTGGALAVLRGHTASLTMALFSSDGSRLVTASVDGTARLWDPRTLQALAVLKGHTDRVTSAAFSPDGTWVVTASADNTARLWDARTGHAVAVLEGHTGSVWNAAFSPDGSRVAAASVDKTARLWDARTGDALAVLQGHTDRVTSAAFSPDGSRVVTASDDKTARLWDARTGQPLAAVNAPNIKILSFSSDGAWEVTASWDDPNVSFATQRVIKLIAPAVEPLTPEQRREFELDRLDELLAEQAKFRNQGRNVWPLPGISGGERTGRSIH